MFGTAKGLGEGWADGFDVGGRTSVDGRYGIGIYCVERITGAVYVSVQLFSFLYGMGCCYMIVYCLSTMLARLWHDSPFWNCADCVVFGLENGFYKL